MNADDVLDAATLEQLERTVGPKTVAEIIDLFLEHEPKRMEAARAAATVGDDKAVADALHSLKSSAGMLGAHTLQNLCQELEQLARSGSGTEAAKRLPELEQACTAAEAALRRKRSR